MGYTHYYSETRFEPEEWMALCDDTRRLVAAAEARGIAIRGGDGTGAPEIGEGEIALNGDASTDDDYETLAIAADPGTRLAAEMDRLPADDGSRMNSLREFAQGRLDKYEAQGSAFNFCKTAHRPYDPVVCAVLIRAAHRNSTFTYSSDGSWVDWSEGADLCRAVFPEDEVRNELGAPPKVDPRTRLRPPTKVTRPGAGRGSQGSGRFTSLPQKRQPKGTPRGGQFAPTRHGEPGASL